MNWNLIVRLSFFGFLMGGVTVALVPFSVEPVLWLMIYGYSAYIIAKRCSDTYFLNGFMLGMLNMAWTTGFHVIFYNIYLREHPQFDLLYASLPFGEHLRLSMIISAPFFGLFFGTLLGFFSFLASKVVSK